MTELKSHEEKQLIAQRALALTELADSLGYTLTIETEAKTPLSVGNYDLVITVRDSHANYRSKPQ